MSALAELNAASITLAAHRRAALDEFLQLAYRMQMEHASHLVNLGPISVVILFDLVLVPYGSRIITTMSKRTSCQ